jgi:four helix bundle protein
MTTYRELGIWQKAMALAVAIYDATSGLPKSEQYGFTSQMRRAAVSIPSNIAEGYGRQSPKQQYKFLENALGSASELETQIELASRLNLLSRAAADALATSLVPIQRGIIGLMKYVAKKASGQPRDRYRKPEGNGADSAAEARNN